MTYYAFPTYNAPFNCRVCNFRTRFNGPTSERIDRTLCLECNELDGIEDSIKSGTATRRDFQDDIDGLTYRIRCHHGDLRRVKAAFPAAVR